MKVIKNNFQIGIVLLLGVVIIVALFQIINVSPAYAAICCDQYGSPTMDCSGGGTYSVDHFVEEPGIVSCIECKLQWAGGERNCIPQCANWHNDSYDVYGWVCWTGSDKSNCQTVLTPASPSLSITYSDSHPRLSWSTSCEIDYYIEIYRDGIKIATENSSTTS
jgi:hypothetical protein